jgi:hypothetical protein
MYNETFNQQAYWAEQNEMNCFELAEFISNNFGSEVGREWIANVIAASPAADLLLKGNVASKFIFKETKQGAKYWFAIQDKIRVGAAKYESNF